MTCKKWNLQELTEVKWVCGLGTVLDDLCRLSLFGDLGLLFLTY